LTLRHILVHLDGTARAAVRLDLAVALAKRTDALLTGLFAEGATLGSSIIATRNPARMEDARAGAREAFETKVSAAGIANEWWQVERGDYGHVVGWTVVCCRYADLAIFGQYQPEDARVPEDLVEQVLLGSGRPLLVVPAAGQRFDVGKRVLVAWTGSREAARAVNDAIPLLQGAEEVTVLALRQAGDDAGGAPAPPVDVVAHLRAHGIPARYERAILDEMGVVNAVLNRAAETSADLTVMGGHGDGGLPLLHRSQTTREMLRSMTTPLLLSH
jgi:nucleotide-binding universal stress UspA family protein